MGELQKKDEVYDFSALIDENCFNCSNFSTLFRVSDADGSLDMDPIEGDISKDKLSSDDGKCFFLFFYIRILLQKNFL